MAKKKRKHKANNFKSENLLTYNTQKPNRQARRLGIEPVKQEEPRKVSKAAVLGERVQQAKMTQERIVPPGMTYGEYMQYLKGKRQELEEKKNVAQNQE